jgi:UDP-glucose 4-epimerase
METILITGGCGFIGTSLISKLLQVDEKINIRVLDNFSVGTPDDLYSICDFSRSEVRKIPRDNGVYLIQGDIRERDIAMLCAKDVSCIVHLAANTGVGFSVEKPILDMECNVLGTLNMLEAARNNGVKKFVFASSNACTGEAKPPIHEELPAHPVSPYGASKLAGEGYCSAYYRTFGVGTSCLRFGNVYGPRSKKKTSVVAKFIRQALAGENCVIYGDGGQTRDFIYIDDLVRALIVTIEKDVGGETFQISTGIEKSVEEIGQLILEELAKRGVEMNIIHDMPRLGDVKRNFADTRKARKILDWEVAIELKEGIANTIEYFLGENG